MKEGNHTPGPWEATFMAIVSSQTHRRVCKISELSDADGDLIIAAPDLLAERDRLRAVLSTLERTLGHLIEAGRIVWTVDDAPEIHAQLEAARDLLHEDDA